MPSWESLNIAAPSLLYPPDSSKWWMRRNLPGTIATTAPNGHGVCIAELRGWLRSVDGSCTGGDPDWHYVLEVDVQWLDNLGIGVEALFLPGDTVDLQASVSASVTAEVTARSSPRAILGEPLIHVEVDGWQRNDTYRGQPPKPSTWTFTNECNAGPSATVWPYDPRNPQANDPPLAAGQYVRIIGSLVSDEPHMSQRWFITDWLLNYGYSSTVATFGQAYADAAQLFAIKELWSGALGETDELNPARYNEIHSPDFIAVLPPHNHNEVVRAVAVVAKSGVTQGDTEEISAEVQAPPRPSPWHVVSCGKHIGPATIASTVQLDQMTLLPSSVRIQVRVQGQSGLGANGKFFAVYRLGWRGIAPRLCAGVSANGTFALMAADADGRLKIRWGSGTAPFWPSAWMQVQSGVGQPGGAVAVVSRESGFYDAFCVGSDHNVYTAATSGGSWGGWWGIPGVRSTPGSPITAVSRSKDKLDVFVADETGRVMTAAWEPSFTGWHAWWSVANGVTAPGGSVAAVSRRTDFLDVFVVGTDGHVWTAAWNPGMTAWAGWWTIPGLACSIGSPIACVSRSTDKLDVFLSDSQGRVMTSSWNPTANAWAPWSQILGGMTAPGAPIAVASRRTDFLDVFHVGNDGQVYTAAWSPGANAWGGWWRIPGIKCHAATPIVALSPAQDVLVVATSSQDGDIMATSWAPGMSAWAPWTSID